MMKTSGYQEVARVDIAEVARDAIKQAYCVVTTEDDMTLVRKKAYEGNNALLVNNVMLTGDAKAEIEITQDSYLQHLLTMNAGAFKKLTAVEFLGKYRFLNEGKQHIILPYAVEVDLLSTDLQLPQDATSYSWISFDEVHTTLQANPSPVNINAYDSHNALQAYLESMTFVDAPA